MLRRPPALSASALSFTGVPLVDALTDLPTWTVVLLFVLATGLSVLRIVFPQQSKDRLAWWQGWWSRPSRLRRTPRKR
ncbi:hypothetical protein SAMN05421812_13636 [Asanoa hainanensis]|uniref:Uncharacterized protein n=2 Tax=Asanoa TaxID=195964 RepID=A0A239PIX2_9ACTN|nr:hypothetical protein [Asanoa hainanensis]GIF75678.1 hypothetical protein Asi02nite_51960 [Asanoa siamensis]SNT66289.1 hypothetical protein SAMN05421812_13636 [Asanoa hainanensis]